MNKTFKMIWSKVKAAWVIVSEIVSSNGGATAVTISHTKPKAGRWIISAALQATLVAGLLTLFAPFAAALPTNPQVIHGTANIQTSGTMMNITNSPNAIINWGSFSIAANETARFIQQSANSNVLNRVTGGDPSRIFGALQSNGRVFLINQNGILIGANARIDVAGLVASTLNLSNQDFLAGKMQFGDGTPGGKLENQGMITTPEGGQVYLIAPDVTNKGTITAPNGDLLLAAGKEVLLVEKTTPEIAYVVSAPEDQAINLGTIAADVGRVGMYGSVVRNSGKISADSATSTGGKIYLRATKKIELAETSSISANGVKGGEIIAMTAQNGVVTGELTARGSITAKGDGSKNSGGFVETSAGKLDLHGVQINTNGGTWLIDPVDFVIGDDNGSGDIAASAVGTALETNDVTIQTTSEQPSCTGLNCQITGGGGTGDSGDITVNDAISWSSGTKLTLESWNDIKINAAITGENGNLKLEAGKDNQTAEVGKITQTENGVITVGTLDVTAKTGITLDKAANEVSKFKATNATSDAISFVNTTPLEITGAVNTAPVSVSGASIAINNTDNITITGAIHAGNYYDHDVKIISQSGSITQTENGKITAHELTVEAAKGIELDKDGNEAWYFNADNSTSGDIKFKNSWNPQDNFGFNINKVVNEGSGNIEITSTDIGVTLGYDSEITSSGGAITLDGTNTKAFTGVMLETGSTITSNGGDINITGKGGNGTENGVGGFNGVNISGVIDSGEGSVNIVGTGGKGFDGNGTVGSWGGTGVALYDVTYINNAPLTITGIKGEDGDGYTGNEPVYGVVLSGTTLNTQTKVLNISGDVYIDSDSRIGLDQQDTLQKGNINFTGNLLNVGSLGVAAGSTIEVAGDYAQEDSGNLYIAVAGTGQNQYSRLVVSGDAQLGGGLNVSIDDDNYTPHFGDYFPFLTATGEASGTFNEIYYNNQNQGYNVGYNLDAGEAARLIYSAGAKTFTNVGGDLDWATDSNWSDSSKPGTGDHVLLSSGYAVTHSTGEDTITALTISSGNNSLNISGGSLNVSGNTVVDGELTVSGGGAAYLQHTSGTGKLSLSGDGVLFLYSGAEIAHYNQTGGTLMTFDDFTVTDSITASGGSVSGAPITDLYFTQKQGDFTLGSSINYFDKITIMVPNGKLTLDEQIQLGDVILQTGEAFINNVGANALQTNGTWQVWSVDPALDTLNGLSYDFKQYNAYRTDSEHSDVLGSGNGLFYTLAPTIGINLQGTVSKTYDGTDAAQLYMDNFAYTGLIGSDTVSNPEYYNAVYNNKNAGTGKTVTIDNLEIAITDNGKPVYGYGGTSTSVSGDIGEITKADLQITNGIAQHKTYDGTTAADVSNSTINALANDDVTLSAANAFFSDKNAGANKNITTAYTISGNDADNYNLIQQSGLRADITPKPVNIIAQESTTTYNGTHQTQGVEYDSNSFITGDNIIISGLASGRNAGIYNSAITLDGADSQNYAPQITDAPYTITKADLQITNGIAQHKTYDGTTAADVSNSTINALANDDVTLSAANAFFSDKNAGANKNITTAYTISGNDADNYNLIQQSGLTADITKADLQIANGIAQNKTYDGTTAADVSNSTINALANDDVTLSAANAFFSDKNAGANKNITTAYTISGDDAVNYNLIQQSGLTADITPKELIISGITAQDKEYDGTTNAQVDTSHVIFDGLVSGDNLTITASGQFEDANAGENKNVNLTSEYGGTDKNNYSITGQQYAKASITEVSTQPPVNPDPGIPDPDPAEKPTPPAEEQAKKQEQNNVTSQISKETQEQPTSAVAPAGLELVGMVADESGEAAGSGGNVSDSTGDAATSADDEDQEKQEAREEQQSTQEQQAEKPAKNYCN